MTGYQPSASIASSASHSSVTAARICAGSIALPSIARSIIASSLAYGVMAEIDLTDRTDQDERPASRGEREILTWERFGSATRDLATEIARRRLPARHRARDRARRAHRRRRARVRARGEELLRDERRVLHERRRTPRRSGRVAADARPRRHPRHARARSPTTSPTPARRSSSCARRSPSTSPKRGTAVLYHKPWSIITPEYVWAHTDRWINFPWSCQDPVVALDNRDA